MVLIVSVTALVVTLVLWSRLAYAIFDPELAAVSGVPVAALEYLLLGQTAVVIVVAVKTVGVVLVCWVLLTLLIVLRLGGLVRARERLAEFDRIGAKDDAIETRRRLSELDLHLEPLREFRLR